MGFIAVFGAACGDDSGSTSGGGGDPGPNADVNVQLAQTSATSTFSQSSTAIAGDGLAAAQGLFALGPSMAGIVQPSGAGAQVADGVGTIKQAVQTGVCECVDTSCTFEGCSDDTWTDGLTIDGSLSWAAGNVVADLTYTGTNASTSYSFGLTMDVTVGTDTIDGTVTSSGEVVAQGVTTSWEANLVFNDVTFNASGCPLSGSMDVTATTSYASQNFSGSSTITFDGSGC